MILELPPKNFTLSSLFLLFSIFFPYDFSNLLLIEKDAINSKSYFFNVNKPYLAGSFKLGSIEIDGSFNNQRSYLLYVDSFRPISIDSTANTWFSYNNGSFDYMQTQVGILFKDRKNSHE